MTYQLDLDPFDFTSFCAGTTIKDVHTVGTSASGAVALDANGVAQIGPPGARAGKFTVSC